MAGELTITEAARNTPDPRTTANVPLRAPTWAQPCIVANIGSTSDGIHPP